MEIEIHIQQKEIAGGTLERYLFKDLLGTVMEALILEVLELQHRMLLVEQSNKNLIALIE